MNLIKYSHACFVLEKDGQSLVVDPGVWSKDFQCPDNVVAIVITHDHPDHLDPETLADIAAKNPEVPLYAHAAVTASLHDTAVSVKAGDTVSVGTFSLTFTGGEHALIDSSLPRIANLGVIVDGLVYYPGDSFAMPPVAVEHLLLPVSAPWCKISEVLDCLRATKPAYAHPTHDHILSEAGKGLVDRMCAETSASLGVTYARLPLGKPVKL